MVQKGVNNLSAPSIVRVLSILAHAAFCLDTKDLKLIGFFKLDIKIKITKGHHHQSIDQRLHCTYRQICLPNAIVRQEQFWYICSCLLKLTLRSSWILPYHGAMVLPVETSLASSLYTAASFLGSFWFLYSVRPACMHACAHVSLHLQQVSVEERRTGNGFFKPLSNLAEPIRFTWSSIQSGMLSTESSSCMSRKWSRRICDFVCSEVVCST